MISPLLVGDRVEELATGRRGTVAFPWSDRVDGEGEWFYGADVDWDDGRKLDGILAGPAGSLRGRELRLLTEREPRLTVLSYSAGQDSSTLLELYLQDPDFRSTYAPGEFLLVMSDTGNEHPLTYEQVTRTQARCREHGIAFQLLRPEDGFHSAAWPSLTGFWERTGTIGSKAFPKTCTDNLKVKPIYRFLNRWVALRYGFAGPDGADRGKQALLSYARRWGRIRMLIGIAAGEESRVQKTGDGQVGQLPLPFGMTGTKRRNAPGWMTQAIQRLYPLIDRGLDRAACQRYLAAHGAPIPLPSNCLFCPFASEVELVWLARTQPLAFEQWADYEAEKLRRNAHQGERNLTVWGNREPLREVLRRALARYGDWSLERLTEYRMSHGHCVTSKY